ncbi:hypothetical protein SAE01_08380 [Segetibacter aerophilus]|uniref:Aerotolerance regulator N-terminal domain-containing protein n=2 Tax=Segetibacter aerophilus TaxID=670293 RepID=A0A512B8Q5_9BACT|nr:hypothetical protein SAE01_08380 [Segetibacter aerophilus]
MLIAKPFYEKQLNSSKEKGWLLIDKNHVQEVYARYKTPIDTLIKSGYTFHYFNPSFEEPKFEDVMKTAKDSAVSEQVSYWTLLKVLDQKMPSKLPVHLFTDNLAKHFTGSRPEVSLQLKWNVYSPKDTISSWIEKAYKTTNDSIRLVVGHGTSTGTYFTYQNVSKTSNNKFRVQQIGKKLLVSFNDTSKIFVAKPVEVDTSTLAITIFTDQFATDATYVQAAVNAVKDFTKYKINVSVVDEVEKIAPSFTWLFWLSEKVIPASFRRNNVFIYEKGKIENTRTNIITGDNENVSTAGDITLFRSIKIDSKTSNGLVPVWKNGFGETILGVERKEASIYHFYSRINPQWNDLPWSHKFPQIIYRLLFDSSANSNQPIEVDRRVMDVSQIQPVIVPEEGLVSKQELVTRKDLSKLFWILALALFLIERMLSFKTKREEAYG